MAKQLKYRRVLLKLSGEHLRGPKEYGIHFPTVTKIIDEIWKLHKLGVEVAVIVGGGNIFRGAQVNTELIDRASADYMGMMATIINGVALKRVLEKRPVSSRLATSLEVRQISEFYNIFNTTRWLNEKNIVILAGGTGSPYFTTDTAAALRAIELNVDVLLKATKVDGIYNRDPLRDSRAKKFSHITFREALLKNIKVMDSTAFSLCMDHNMPIAVFKLTPGILQDIVLGQGVGTIVTN